MLRSHRHQSLLIVLTASVAVCAAAVDAGRASPPGRGAETAATLAKATEAEAHSLECRATKATLDSELEELRTSCEAAVAAFEACRASRPPIAAWSDVELFSCGFDMSTDLARGDLDATASLEACGASDKAPRTAARPARNCPVPSCESDLELLEEAAARQAC
ncbi:MAG TPA: hypothetical protein VI197_14075 [Polyangiaceae bacterium]